MYFVVVCILLLLLLLMLFVVVVVVVIVIVIVALVCVNRGLFPPSEIDLSLLFTTRTGESDLSSVAGLDGQSTQWT